MPLPEITLLSQLEETTPQGDVTTVAELDDYIRQLKAFLKQYLAVAHDDRGELLEDSAELTFNDINGNLHGDRIEPNTLSSIHVVDKNITAGSGLLSGNIADGAIGEDELADNAVTEDKIADGAVTDTKIVGVSATKLTGVVPTANLPSLSAGEVEASQIAVHASLSPTAPGLLVATDQSSTNKLAKIGGVLSAALTTGATIDELTFSFVPSLSQDTGVVAVLGEDAINTPTLPTGSPGSRIRNGWTVSGNANFISLGDAGGPVLSSFSITRNGLYLIFMYITSFGKLTTVPATAEIQSILYNDDNERVLVSNVVKTDGVQDLGYANFALGSVAIEDYTTKKATFYVQTDLTAADGNWVIGENGKRASVIGIIGIA